MISCNLLSFFHYFEFDTASNMIICSNSLIFWLLIFLEQQQQQNGYGEQPTNGVHDQEVPIDDQAYEEVNNHVSGEDVVDLQNGLQNGHAEVDQVDRSEPMQQEVIYDQLSCQSFFRLSTNHHDKRIIYFIYRKIVFYAGIRKEISQIWYICIKIIQN